MSETAALLFMTLCITFLRPHSIDGFGINLIKIPDEDLSQAVCTIALLRKYFQSGEPLSGAVLSMSITSASLHIQQNILRAIHTEVELGTWSVVIKDAHKDVPPTSPALILHEKPQCYFLIVENFEDDDMEDIFEVWKTKVNWNPLAQFVVYLASVEETDEEMTELMVEILLNFLNKKIYNVNVIGQNEENGFYYGKTVFPYHPQNNCGNRVIAIETLDLCDYRDKENDEPNEEDFDVEESAEGAEVVEDAEGTVGVEGAESTEDAEATESAEGAEDAEGTVGVEGAESTEDVEATESAEGAENAEGTVGIEGAESTKDAEATESAEGAEDAEGTVGVEGAESTKDTEATESAEDVDHVEDVEEQIDMKTNETFIPYDNESATHKNSEILDSSTHTEATSTPPPEVFKNTSASDSPKVYLEELYRALFLDKFPKDLSGCPLIAAYRPWEPYIFTDSGELQTTDYEDYSNSMEGSAAAAAVDDSDDNFPETRLNGIEFEMVQTIGERLHITIDIQVENRNLYHLFQKLIDGDIEMVIGGIDEDPSISQFVSSTIPYHQDDLTWCVAKAKRQHNLFNFLASFELSSWVLTLAFILAATLNILFIQNMLHVRLRHLDRFLTIANRIYGVLLSQSIHLKYNIGTTLKLSFGTAFFMALMFTNIYQSFLVSTLTTPQSSYQISHLEEIYRHRMTIMGSVENVRHLNKEGKIFKYIREKFQMCYDIEECLRQAALDENVAVAVSRQHSFYNPRIPRDQLYCFNRDENLYVYLVTMLLPKKFHLLHKINPVIQHIIESGHMQKWARDLDMKRMIHEEIHRIREETFKRLTLRQIYGSFVFGATCLVGAVLTLLLERCIYRKITARPRSRWRIVRILHRILRQC